MGGAKYSVDSSLAKSTEAGSVILLRRNFEYSGEYYNNLSQTKTNTLIDLNGFTFTVVHQPMFNAQKKTAQDTAITVKNGKIVVSGGEAVIKLSSFASNAAPNAIPANITLNECTVDLTEAGKAVTLFNMAGELGKVNAVIKGGSIIASTSSVAFANTEGANANSSLTFAKAEGGEYTRIYNFYDKYFKRRGISV